MVGDSHSNSAIATKRGTVERIKRESGQERSPVGYRTLDRLIARGDLPVVVIEGAEYIRWSDWTEYVSRQAQARVRPLPPSRAERIELDVRERLRRESVR